ncbi:single-stranded DNA-binding protein [uncultured Fibrella sp.]|uniref:single-stranded DNA-binding protein n=1 Tax=uncultured Fibrella sp. TaxID=1284596 RepID=UPI0035CC59BA
MLQGLIIGRLGRDAEVKEGKESKQFVSFAVAVDKSYKDASGQKIERTEWVDCVADRTGVTPYLVKGQQVVIQGDIKAENYVSNKDQKVYAKLKIRAYSIQLVGSKPESSSAGQPAAAPPVTAPVPSTAAALGGFAPNSDDDLPF